MFAKRLHARRVAQVESENFQPAAPLLEIQFRRITHRRVARETRADDKLRASTKKLDARLVTDLHASAGEQRYAPAQVCGLGALEEIQLRAHDGGGRRCGAAPFLRQRSPNAG